MGNLLADEVLWQSRLDPQRRSGDLATEELDRRELRQVIRRAIDKGGVHTGEVIAHRKHGGTVPAAERR